jgi:hypothetical protein
MEPHRLVGLLPQDPMRPSKYTYSRLAAVLSVEDGCGEGAGGDQKLISRRQLLKDALGKRAPGGALLRRCQPGEKLRREASKRRGSDQEAGDK